MEGGGTEPLGMTGLYAHIPGKISVTVHVIVVEATLALQYYSDKYVRS